MLNLFENDSLVGHLHTMYIYSENPPISPLPITIQSHFRKSEWGYNEETGVTYFKSIFNPNRKNDYCDNFEEVLKRTSTIMSQAGITDFTIKRVDCCIDSYHDNLNEMFKLNKCLLLLIACAYKVKNLYQSTDPLLLNKKTLRGENRWFQIENYNKALESNHSDIVKNRFEMRALGLNNWGIDQIPLLANAWSKRFDKSLKYFEALQVECNAALFRQWGQEQGIQVKSISEFIRKYEDSFFTHKQLSKFLHSIGSCNAEKSAYNMAYQNEIELFSYKEIKLHTEKLKHSLHSFFNHQ